MMLFRIRYLWISILVFSGIGLFSSCEQNTQQVYMVGGGFASAKFGDSTITVRDTIFSTNLNYANSGAYSIHPVSQISFVSSPFSYTNTSNFQLSIYTNINTGWVGTYNLIFGFYENQAQVSGIYGAKNGSFYTTDSTHKGVFTITSYNPELEIITGTFNFTAIRDSLGTFFKSDTIVVSNGNFVANLKYLIN